MLWLLLMAGQERTETESDIVDVTIIVSCGVVDYSRRRKGSIDELPSSRKSTKSVLCLALLCPPWRNYSSAAENQKKKFLFTLSRISERKLFIQSVKRSSHHTD
jgi:hypothetical protein